MSSIIEGYNYDIFISYRQKDNKGEKWVSEFVETLKTELESTFKEEISVYFDFNPHDGLLETHDVDESLKEKLRCLIFIPIISRTYCDPKSFAWENEFKAFVEFATNDQFGLKVRLPNGNVAGRVLPVIIHDLHDKDRELCESVLGGFLRGVEFIYREPGVNKPLSGDDDEKKNLNKTRYRIQVNKVANSIDDIISALKAEAEPDSAFTEKEKYKDSLKEIREEEKNDVREKPAKTTKGKIITSVTALAILILAGILLYPKIFRRSSLDKLRSSGEKITVAVMPFQNITNDTTWNIWQSGIQDILITNLSNVSDELKVRQTESINRFIQSQSSENYASITPALGSIISQKLDATLYVYGNIKQAGSVMRVYAQLIDTNTEEVLKSFQIESAAEESKIFHVIDSLSGMIKDFLIISELIKEGNPDFIKYGATTKYPEALKFVIGANNAFDKMDYRTAIDLYIKAIAVDSEYIWPAIRISFAYLNSGSYEQGREWCRKIYEKREQMPIFYKTYANILNASYDETPYEAVKYFRQLLEIDDQLPDVYFDIGQSYTLLQEYTRAIPEFEKVLEIYKEWGTIPNWVMFYVNLGIAYHKTEQFKKEEKLYKEAEENFPGDIYILYNRTLLQLTQRDTINANESFNKLNSWLKENSVSEANMATAWAGLFTDAGHFDKAEEYYRQALSLEPESPARKYSLAWFLINKDRNIDEGIVIVDSILKSGPDNFNYLDIKGWGLYKQGQYPEALEVLLKSWDLRLKNAIYDHEAFLHLEAAKKAVEGRQEN